MKKINIFASKDAITTYTLAPIRLNKERLYERGYRVNIFYKMKPGLVDCDVLCLVSKPTHLALGDRGPIYQDDGEIIKFLIEARKTAGRIIWMDDSDSTSVTHFELLPYIDFYLKKQIFKDKSLYKIPYYGGRIFSDYYHNKFNVCDDTVFDQFYPLKEADWDKVKVSWNIGLGDMRNAFTWRTPVQRMFPDYFLPSPDIKFVSPSQERPVDLFLRTSANLSRKSIAFHRQEMLRQLTTILNQSTEFSGMVGNTVQRRTKTAEKLLPEIGGRLSMATYRDIVAHTKIAPSPFGWGEIGVRDYEAFIFGALLLKPDVSHMATWPDIFIADETYVPVDWSFDDLGELIGEMVSNSANRLRIARNGQDAYRESISMSGMEKFCDWFLQQIGEQVC